MNYFMDTEFDENGKTIELISIAIVAEDGREMYAVSNEFDPAKCNDWVKANVLPKLPSKDDTSVWWKSRTEIRDQIAAFLKGDDSIRIWAYFADYDWVAFCQLFGAMVDLPKGYPMYCLDLKQVIHHGKIEDVKKNVPQREMSKHDALDDARWNRDVFFWIRNRGPISFQL
jgi:hypothetical protein